MSDQIHDPAKCKGTSHCWRISPCNEDGWGCPDCGHVLPGEPPGYSPQLDREETVSKVDSILQHLHHWDFIHISNSSEGDSAVHFIAGLCHELGLFDQLSIITLICQHKGSAKYWRELGEAILNGRDPRRRCDCGKLATRFQGDRAWCSDACQKKEVQQGRLSFLEK